MIAFHRIGLADKADYDSVMLSAPERGCEYSFANLYLWGRQEVAFIHGCIAFFSHFYGKSVYPYPIGNGDKKAVIEDILADAKQINEDRVAAEAEVVVESVESEE